MKSILTITLIIIAQVAIAQWSNTANNFADTLHMPVSVVTGSQRNPLVLTSYPDGGYFVIWEDDRDVATNKTDIYAQKYDNAGNRLWVKDGLPIATGPNTQHYTFSSNQDYRNRSFVATDSAGGFYICYSDDSVTNYVYERLMVQHVKPNGNPVFAGPGLIVARSGAANLQMAGQLIPDGSKGFFLAYKQKYGYSGNDYIQAYCYRDENGRLQYYGGGRTNENALETSSVAPCGIKTDVIYPGTTVYEYNIWYDQQGGCNVIMDMNGNNGVQGRMLTFNKLWRAKKNAKSKTLFRNTSGTACPRTKEYSKGNVYMMYTLKIDYQSVTCTDIFDQHLYAYTNYRLISNGYQVIDNKSYDYGNPKGVTIKTDGTINVTEIAAVTRSLVNNTVTDFILKGFTLAEENFDSIPYQHTTFNNPDFGYNNFVPARVNKLNFFRDTLLASGNYYFDFSLAGGGGEIYAAGLLNGAGGRSMRMQHLSVDRKTPDSFAITYNTNIVKSPEKAGVAIGKEINSGFSGSNISFDQPLILVSNKGNALFYTREYYRSARVSHIGSGVQLSWGAMGRAIGAGSFNNSYYNLEQPVVAFDSTGNSAIIAWRDNRYIPGSTTYDDIYMRHLDNLNSFNYTPPVSTIKLLLNPYGPSSANPAVLFGTSNNFTPIELIAGGQNAALTPMMQIKDDNNLGILQATIYQHSAAIRKYNNQPYLNRNYTVLPETDATGKTINSYLYFTKQEFDALKNADNSIIDPAFLDVIRQPSTVAGAPAAYIPVPNEERLPVNTWDSVDGGYRLWVTAHGLGNFFIQKMATTSICAGNNTSFTSSITGAAYQWQVNTGGSNYYDIANGSGYSGVNTTTLTLTNISGTLNGNRYRCVIDNTKVSTSFYLQIANTWTGAVNTVWENAGNWSCGKIPDANTDVIITSGTVIVNSTAAICRSVKVSTGASLNIAPGFKLTVTH